MNPSEKTLYIVIGCDTDPDRPRFVKNVTEEAKSWRGVTEGISLMKELVRDLKDSEGNAPCITWLLRVDEQIDILYGEYGWVLRNFYNLFSDLQSGGDELGWHPHFYRFDKDLNKWYQEVFDVDWQIRMLDKAFEAYAKIFPGLPKSVRMGWDYHNNATLKKLADLNIKVDFSALPGLRTANPSPKARPYNVYDWFLTPRAPYFPSSTNYQRGPFGNESPLNILEVPIFISGSLFWGLISGLQMARKMKDPSQFFQSLIRPSFLINITGKPKLFAPLVAELDKQLRKTDGNIIFATYFHADELLDNEGSLYSRQNMRANLEALIRVCDKQNIRIKFLRAMEISRQT